MDSITVEISALPEGRLKVGSLVEGLRLNQTVDDLARDAGRSLTDLGDRFERRYCGARMFSAEKS
jgi:alanine racemase